MCNSIRDNNRWSFYKKHENVVTSIPKYGYAWKIFKLKENKLIPKYIGGTPYYKTVCNWVNWYHPIWLAHHDQTSIKNVGFCLFLYKKEAVNRLRANTRGSINKTILCKVQYDGGMQQHYERMLDSTIVIAKSFRIIALAYIKLKRGGLREFNLDFSTVFQPITSVYDDIEISKYAKKHYKI